MKRSSLIAAVLLHWMVAGLAAHSIHQSTAEAEYNPTTRKLEVSLTVFVNDLEVALTRQCEREMQIEKTPEAEFDDQIKVYLSKNFEVTDVSGEISQLEWVGRKLDAENAKSDEPTVTLYVEVKMPGGLDDSRIKLTLFCDRFKDQRNLLMLRRDMQKVEMQFSRENPSRKLGFPDH